MKQDGKLRSLQTLVNTRLCGKMRQDEISVRHFPTMKPEN